MKRKEGIVSFELKPEHPHNAGVEEQVPELAQIEGGRLLANETAASLRKLGFTDDEIGEWALTYIATQGSGDLDSFLAWIREIERVHGDIA